MPSIENLNLNGIMYKFSDIDTKNDFEMFRDGLIYDGNGNMFSAINQAPVSGEYAGISYVSDDNMWFSFTGTAQTQFNLIVYYDSASNDMFKPGDTLHFHLDSYNATNNIFFTIYYQPVGGSLIYQTAVQYSNPDCEYSIPMDADKLYFRYEVLYGETVNDSRVRVNITNITHVIPDTKTVKSMGIIADETDLNTISTNGIYLLAEGRTYAHCPVNLPGFLLVFNSGTVFYQMAMPWDPSKIYARRKHINQDYFSNWYSMGSSQEVTNNYTFNEYQNTFTATVTPTITTDDNNWLQPTGDQTDVSASILALLQTGCCNLAPGTFFVDPNKLDMPSGSILRGCGESSVIVLKGYATSVSGYAIKMNAKCQVSDLSIDGYDSRASVVGDRHGILWQGNYTESRDDYIQPRLGFVNNVRIKNFSGGGITCYDTGYATFNNINVVNAYIENCTAGINVAYWSEYHQFTNVHTQMCTFGCINNGGNNIFTNCDFSSSSDTAFLIDNDSEQSPNNAHGSAIGCVFNHIGNNTGIGVRIVGAHNGFVFDGCQFFFSQIDLENSYGVSFTNCNFGLQNCNITIVDGGLTLFANNMHQGEPVISITGNQNVHFVNCYVRQTGDAVGV